jgi:hypothetical protein
MNRDATHIFDCIFSQVLFIDIFNLAKYDYS